MVAGPLANGAQVLHLSVALCVLNDTYREAERLGITVNGVAVEADGGFDEQWSSTGITYAVAIDSAASDENLANLSAWWTKSRRSRGRSVPALRWCAGSDAGRCA